MRTPVPAGTAFAWERCRACPSYNRLCIIPIARIAIIDIQRRIGIRTGAGTARSIFPILGGGIGFENILTGKSFILAQLAIQIPSCLVPSQRL